MKIFFPLLILMFAFSAFGQAPQIAVQVNVDFNKNEIERRVEGAFVREFKQLPNIIVLSSAPFDVQVIIRENYVGSGEPVNYAISLIATNNVVEGLNGQMDRRLLTHKLYISPLNKLAETIALAVKEFDKEVLDLERRKPQENVINTDTSGIGPALSQVRTISGGVVNGKAISLPKPAYPVSALKERASGAVAVQVLIDEKGNVISAKAVSGNPLLQGAAEAAANVAKFSPTVLSGQVVRVSGIIVYNFVL